MEALRNSMTCWSDPDAKRNRRLSHQLKKWNNEEQKVVNLLLLGTGESGKTTVTKQMKIIHIHGFTDEERREKIKTIRKNISDAILTIVGAMSNLNIKLENPDHQDSVDYIMKYAVEDSFDYPQEFFDHVTRLWSDGGIQESYSRANEYQLIDSAKYFLDKICDVRLPDYLPSDQDILRNRVITNTIQKIDFEVPDRKGNVNFSVFDVGGQRGERRKWIQVFETVTAILFVLDCSCFDTVLREDHTKNRLVEAVETFEQVWNSKFLRNVSVLLFINKIDLLQEKISAGKSIERLVNSLPDDDPYHEYFQDWNFWEGPTADEEKEFVQAFPSKSPAAATGKDKSKPTVAQLKQEKGITQEAIYTAVFIKRLCMRLSKSMSCKYPDRNQAWHKDHECFHFYTCAVDTNTIKNIFQSVRTVMIKEQLRKMGIKL